jgi:hypothetical protein
MKNLYPTLTKQGNLKPFPLKSGMRTEVSTIPTLVQHNTGIPSQSNKTGEKIKWIQIRKEETNCSYLQAI